MNINKSRPRGSPTMSSSSLLIINIIILSMIALSSGSGVSDDINPYRHTQVLDREGKYVLDWLVNWEENRVFFNVTVQTRGYVGFGLSKKGLMDGADIVIGGVYPNGKPYLTDRHGVGHQAPELDESQDYILHSAWESKTHTFLSFSRLIETCDEADDLPITEDEITLIWAFGERDNEQEYHYQNRGDFPAYLLDPDLTPREVIERSYRNVTTPRPIQQLGDIKVWNIPISQVMPSVDTSYLCTFHKAPTNQKQHIVGYRTVFNSDVERRHIHHFLLYKCYPPSGVEASEMFQRFVGRPAEQCYMPPTGAYPIPTQYCLEMRHEWAVGAGPYFLPDHVGVPMSESPNDYYMWQVHYDNPNEIPNIRLNFSLEIYYTDKLRQHDAGLLFIGSNPTGTSIIIPPSETNHIIYGHCASQCTKKMFPETGINVFGARVHTHLAGRQVRMIHIQGQNELLPLTPDDNYDFNFQPFRILREERKINPGDMLISKCNFDTTNRNKSVTVWSVATRNEMCHTFLSYYPYIRKDVYGQCVSEVRSDVYRNFLDIYETTWSDELRDFVVTSPQSNAGLTVPEVAGRKNWTIDERMQLQTHHRFLPQVSTCDSLHPDVVIPTARSLALAQAQITPQQALAREEEVRSSGTLSDLDMEIRLPTSEFVSLWPKDLISYPETSRCLKKPF